MNLKRNNERLFLYVATIITVPYILLVSQSIEIGMIAVLIASVLYFVDPVIKSYRKYERFKYYFWLCLLIGVVCAFVKIIFPQVKSISGGVWLLFFLVYSFLIKGKLKYYKTTEQSKNQKGQSN